MPGSTNLLNDLNPIQQEATKQTAGPILVLAGAGSGKTRVLTYKVAYLIKEKAITPENILVVTFTNKAAGEMKERIIKLVGSGSAQPIMGTFHSICAKLLRKEGHNIGLSPGFSIYDEGDALEAVKEAMSVLNIATQKTNPGAVRNIISGAKNELISELEYPQYARGYFQEIVAKIYIEYQKILRRNKALDFDDLLMETIRLFQTQPTILEKYQIQFQYILVDEYQDTNAAQYQLIKLLAKRNRNLCVVGDASQAIYGFRGADFRNIVNFKNDYPEAKVFNLDRNYRSTQIILDAAQAVISENKMHPILKLWTDQKGGAKIKLYEARSEVDEANFVIDEILKLDKSRTASRQDPETNFSSFAILYRTNAQSRAIEEAFLKQGIPYHLVGGIKFYERKEIKDVLAYLRLIQNPEDSISRKRIEKIGKTRAGKFDEYSEQLRKTQRISESDIQMNRNSDDPSSSESFRNVTTLELMDKVLEVTGYLEYLDDGTDQGKSRIENVKELKSVAEQFPNLTQFLENVALVQNEHMPDSDKQLTIVDKQNAVTLMTIHASKGLEFPIIFLVGMEEGLFPHSRSMLNPDEMEEERRLAYVAITRAKQQIFLTYARSRLYFGQRSSNLVSRFLASIPESLLDSKVQFRDDSYQSLAGDLDDIYSSKDDDEWLNT